MEFVKIIRGPTLEELRINSSRKSLEFTVKTKDGEIKKIKDLVDIYDKGNGTIIIYGFTNWRAEYKEKL
ncbi:MAG: hypothetical protein WC427_03240 [Candidatus Paceibacterota bacterium]|jgi:hypothetical protein